MTYTTTVLMRRLASLQAGITMFALIAMSSPLMVMAQEETLAPETENTEVVVEEESDDSDADFSLAKKNDDNDDEKDKDKKEDDGEDDEDDEDDEDEGGDDGKVEVCHVTPSQWQVLKIAESAWLNGHQAQHEEDFLIQSDSDEDWCKANKLRVEKVVNGGPASPEDFSFTVTEYEDDDGEVEIKDEQDYSFNEEGFVYVETGDDEDTFYTVVENEADNYVASYEDCEDVSFGNGNNHNFNVQGGNHDDDEDEDDGMVKTCVVTNTYDAPEEPLSCEITSDTVDFVVEKNDNAVETFVHNAWADLVGGVWIWGDPLVLAPGASETQTFKKNFEVTGTPTSATLFLAADNGAKVFINGDVVLDQLAGLDDSDKNYDDPAEEVDILSYLVAGENTIEIVVTNLGYDTTDPEVNPAGLNYRIEIEDASCKVSEFVPEPAEETATLHATKIICPAEDLLPNWGAGTEVSAITATTASEFLETHPTCSLAPGWDFQWATDEAGDPDDNNTEALPSPWETITTGAGGTVSVEVPADINLRVREVLKPGYIPFTGQNTTLSESAEMYCGSDVLNYDNWEFVDGTQANADYYCVAFNAPVEEAPQCDATAQSVLLSSDADEGGLLTNDETGRASVVSWLHASWLQQIGQWIWKETSTSNDDAAGGAEETFTRTFSIIGTPKDSVLEIAADNGYEVRVNGDFLASDAGEFNYGATDSIDIPAEMLKGGVNTITFTVTNIDHETENTPETNPAGLLYKLTVKNDECDPYEPPVPTKATVIATKVVCDSEQYLPNGAQGKPITAQTAASWVAQSNEHCHLESGWVFEWGGAGAGDGGPATVGHAPNYTEFVSTNANGVAQAEITVADVNGRIEMREQLKSGYVPFTNGQGETPSVSAEMYCADDAAGYDNWEWINNPVAGTTYHCVAFNAHEGSGDPETPTDPNAGQDKVHIYKYLKTGEVTAQIPNDSTAPSFPMVSTWQAGNLSAGATSSGAYVLGNNGGGTALKYAADTSPMDNGSYYTTSEVTGGDSVVVPNDGQCSPGKYRLLGYKSGTSLENAESASLSLTAPEFFNITSDKYVIVVNEACPNGDGGGDNDGTVVIVKHSVGGDGTFAFDLSEQELIAGVFVPDATIPTTDGYGTTTLTVNPGAYNLTEYLQEGWTLQGVTCEYDGESEGTTIQNGKTIYVGANDTVTCTFTNVSDSDDSEQTPETPQDNDDDGNTGNRVRSPGNSGGLVLGASTECSPLLLTYLGKSFVNTPEEVTKLQNFLNSEMGGALPVSGAFDKATEEAVHSFQIKYWEDVLKPWFGLPGSPIQDSDDSSGIVFKTTKWKINNLFCPGSEAMPVLP